MASLEHLEDEREDCIFPFLSKLFRDFHSHQARTDVEAAGVWREGGYGRGG